MKKIFASVFLAMTVLITGCSANKSEADTDGRSFISSPQESSENNESAPEIIQSTEKNSAPNSVAQSAASTPQSSGSPQQSVPEGTLPNSDSQPDPTEGNETYKILVVYFSCTNTTKTLAEYASDILGADIYEIVPAEAYTEADLAYYTNGRADREQADSAVRPAISGSVGNMSDYDTIILGYPIWHGQAPRIISTFLESYDFSGKTIVPFCTSHSSGIGSSASDLHALCSAEWLSGRRFGSGTSGSEVEKWLKEIGITDR